MKYIKSMTGYRRKQIRNGIILFCLLVLVVFNHFNTREIREANREMGFWEAAAEVMGRGMGFDRPPREFFAPDGSPIDLPDEFERIVTLGPSVTGIMVALGLGDRIIATDADSLHIPGVPDGLPVIDLWDIDIALLRSLQPDFVGASENIRAFAGGKNPLEPLRGSGIITMLAPERQNIGQLYAGITFFANFMNTWGRGMTFIDETYQNLRFFFIRTVGIPAGERSRVYFETADAPYLYGAGGDTLFGNLLQELHADNILPHREGNVRVSCEQVIEANPDVIITNVSPQAVYEIKARPGWESIAAVANGNVHFIDTGAPFMPTHNVIAVLHEIAVVVYPEIFAPRRS